MLNDLDFIIEDKLKYYSKYFHEKFELLSDLFTDDDKGKMERTFKEGVHIFFKSHFRYLKDNFGINDAYKKVSNLKYIDAQLKSYFFEFVQSLKASQRRGETKGNALRFVKQSHVLNPDTVDILLDKHTDELVAVKRFAYHSKNPEKATEDYLVKVGDLLKKYPDELSAVKRFALRGKNPEKAMEDYLVKVAELSKKYSDENINDIKFAVLRYSDPEQYLKDNK